MLITLAPGHQLSYSKTSHFGLIGIALAADRPRSYTLLRKAMRRIAQLGIERTLQPAALTALPNSYNLIVTLPHTLSFVLHQNSVQVTLWLCITHLLLLSCRWKLYPST